MPVIENLFTPTNLTKMHKEIKMQKMSLRNISFRYQKGELLVNSEGHTFTNQEEEYFETIEDNLEFADLRWLTPICTLFSSAIIDAKTQVHPSGEFEHDKIQIIVNQIIPNEQSAEQYMYPRLKNFIKLRQFLKEVEFKGFDYSIRHMIFYFEIDGKQLHSIMKNAAHNQQVADQWLATIDRVNLYNKGKFRFCDKVPVVGGKFNFSANQSVVSFKFGSKKNRG